MASCLRQLSLPLWSPFAGAGVPFLATPSTAVFYPPNLLYFVAPGPFVMGLLALLHLALAGAGTFFFCRRLKIGLSGSALAGLGFMLSNAVWINYVNPHYLNGVAWLPVIFLVGERLYSQPSLRHSMIFAIVIALQFLTGAGQFFLYTLYFLCLYLILRAIFNFGDGRLGIRQKISAAKLIVLGLVVAVLLCGIQLIPSLEMLRGSVRSGPLPKSLVHFPQWYFQWWWPFLDMVYSKWTGLFENQFHQGGLLQVFFLLCALLTFRDRRLYVLLILFVVSVILSTGYSTPFYQYFAMLPGIAASRQPNRIAVVTAFAIAVLSGLGLNNCLHLLKEDKSFRRVAPIAAVAAVYGLILALVHSHGALGFFIAGLIFLVALLTVRTKWMTYVALGAIISFGAWETGSRHAPTSSHPQAVPEYLRPVDIQLLGYLKQVVGDERIYVQERGVPPFPFAVYRGALAGLFSICDYHPAVSARTEDVIEVMTSAKPVYPDGRIDFTPESGRPDIMNLLSVRYLLLFKQNNPFSEAPPNSPMAQFYGNLRQLQDFSDYVLYENPLALPRAYMVKSALVAADKFEALRQLCSLSPRSLAILEGEESRDVLSRLHQDSTIDEVAIPSLSPNRVTIDVNSESGGLLVLTDSFYPGWNAAIDGGSTPIYRANYLFRAVYVPPGRHTIQFSFLPSSLLLGLGLSGFSLLLLIGILLLSLRKRPIPKDFQTKADSPDLSVGAGSEGRPLYKM